MLDALCLAVLPALVANEEGEFPEGFRSVQVGHHWEQPVDLAFLPAGHLLVAEKSGRVFFVRGDDHEHDPVIDLSEEVANIGSHGMKSLVVHPDFATNGWLYLMYDVDRHHAHFFGTPQYDPNADDFDGPSIGRITRYTLDAATGYRTVVPGSRTVLVGESLSTGIPLVAFHHETGCLRFGEDGSLLVSCGDSADNVDFGFSAPALQALAEGIIQPHENIGSFRGQSLGTLGGKILRLDPVTGDGLSSNPFFVPSDPRSPASRIWAYGMRNPFRFSVVPHSGADPDHPGVLIIGDVGLGSREELSVSYQGGENFGWPLFEGLERQPIFQLPYPNQLAPNPLFGQDIPGVGMCSQTHLTFPQLLAQETLAAPSWPNPCDPSQEIPASIHRSMHTRPILEWGHSTAARIGTFGVGGEASTAELGSPGLAVQGSQFDGSCVIAGTWYEEGAYPSEFGRRYFFCDHTGGWIKTMGFEADRRTPTDVRDFANAIETPVTLAVSPVSGELYYVQISGAIHRVVYEPGNQPPTALALATPKFGPSPLTVEFTGGGSDDPEEGPLNYEWDFGDGTPTSLVPSPRHVFPSVDVTDQGTVVAAVLELDPPQMTGSPGFVPDVIADGIYPDEGTGSFYPIYTTMPLGTTDPDPIDWVGYTFPTTHTFHKLVYQEAFEQAIGGWFDEIFVQVRVNGTWTDVTNQVSAPPFVPFNGTQFERWEFHFDPIVGDGIRIYGVAGGTERFVMVSELRAIAAGSPAGPTRYDVTLEVSDGVNLVDQDEVAVWVDNTPPAVTIQSPVHGGVYDPLSTVTVQLDAVVTDAESAPIDVECEWRAYLHHNDHTHPEPVIDSCSGTLNLPPHGDPGEELFFWRFELTARDEHGLETRETAVLFDEPPGLLSDEHELSVADGAVVPMQLNAGPGFAGAFYWLLMSGSGMWPGLDLVTLTLPLNQDRWTNLTILYPNSDPYFSGFVGSLDAQGRASAVLTLPPGDLNPELLGEVFHFAFVTSLTPPVIVYASNPIELSVTE